MRREIQVRQVQGAYPERPNIRDLLVQLAQQVPLDPLGLYYLERDGLDHRVPQVLILDRRVQLATKGTPVLQRTLDIRDQ